MTVAFFAPWTNILTYLLTYLLTGTLSSEQFGFVFFNFFLIFAVFGTVL